jgi:hypothetical protein
VKRRSAGDAHARPQAGEHATGEKGQPGRRHRIRALALAAALVVQLSLAAAVAVAGPAVAGPVPGVGPGDDRLQTAPTSWWTYTGVSAATLSSLLSAHNARLTSLQVDNTAGPTFTAVMVSNTGSYASGWWWYYGVTSAQVGSLVSTNQARLISAQAYATPGGVRFAVVMVANTGSAARAWWWYYGSTSFLSSQLAAHHARMVQVSPYPGGGYLGIMVDNTGPDATAWWWYVHASPSTLGSLVSANHARLIDLSRNSDGTYDAVMYYNSGIRWYWYYGQSPAGAVAEALQLGERIIDATSYYVGGVKYYAVVMTRNTNALSEELWNIIGPKVDSGAYGFYLKQVNGATQAALENTLPYEPASALKVLYHAASIHAESLGAAHDSDTIVYHYDPAAPTNAGICPDNYPTTAGTNLKNADSQMMWNSDNRMTKGILDKYGKSAVLSYGASLGLTATAINHDIGCPTAATHNQTTLVDLGKVYEAYQDNVITANPTWKAQFKARMLNESNYPGFRNQICPVVSQEAAILGKSPATATAFCQAMTWIAKGGSYQYGGSLPYQVSWDGLSLTGVPHQTNGTITPRYFVFGEFVDGTTINSQAEANSINTARGQLYTEGMRPYIYAALATWN